MPAPDGPNTLAQALNRLSEANIELLDIALRRPSLDEVFLTLTTENTADRTASRELGEPRPTSGRHRLGNSGNTGAKHLDTDILR
jgi:hypothetical protein